MTSEAQSSYAPGELHIGQQIGNIRSDTSLSAYISKGSMHQPLKFNTLNFNTYNGVMWELGDDQTDISMVCEKYPVFH